MSTRGTLRLALIGHTNTGKTSVLRSLLRDHAIGDVSDEAGTTRVSTEYRMSLAGSGGSGAEVLVSDTPGLEDAGRLLAAVRGTEREAGISPAEALERTLGSGDIDQREAGPLRSLAASDVGLLVFDVREPPRQKYWEEHELLRLCGVPLVAVLNCTARPGARTDEWEAALRKHGLHAAVRYDAWTANEADAQRLFVKVRELAPSAVAETVDRVMSLRRADERRRLQRSATALADLLLDASTAERSVPKGEEDGASDEFRLALGRAWERFRARTGEAWGLSPEQLATVLARGSATESGAGRGYTAQDVGWAMSGATIGGALTVAAVAAAHGGVIDVATGGASLGLGALLGGGGALAWQMHRRLAAESRGERLLRISDEVVAGLAKDGLNLIRAVRTYGAAAEAPVRADTTPSADPRLSEVTKELRRLRAASPAMSRLDRPDEARSDRAIRRRDALAGHLLESLGEPDRSADSPE